MFRLSDLHQEQRDAIKDAANRRNLCVADDCGFGKTVVALTLHWALKKKQPMRTLVVSTASGVKGTWSKEHKNWEHLRDLKLKVLLGSPKQRERILTSDVEVLVVSYNNLKWLEERYKGPAFDLIVADEVSCLKGPTSAWRASLIKLSKGVKWRLATSATPKPREADDYWGVCRWLDDGACLGKTLDDFRGKYMSSFNLPGTHTVLWKLRHGSAEKIQAKCQHLFVEYGLNEASTVPIETITVRRSLSPASQEIYDRLEDEQSMFSVTGTPDDEDNTLNATQTNAKLNQLCSGFVYVDRALRMNPDSLGDYTPEQLVSMVNEKRIEAIDLFPDRVDMLEKLLGKIKERHGDTPVIICYTFKHELVQLQRLLPQGTPDTEGGFQKKWNRGRIPYLFLQYTRSSMSLNLQDGGNVMVFYSPTFRWADDYQIIRRIARQGQTAERVYAYRMYMKGTMDDMKARRLTDRFKGHTAFRKLILKKHRVRRKKGENTNSLRT